MSNSITHFMWGYQIYFRISRQSNAESLFNKLDETFKPEVFLVGICRKPKAGSILACVEPEDEFWIESEAFNGVNVLADRLMKEYPEGKLTQSHPIAQQQQENGLIKRSIRDAVKQVIEGYPSKPSDMIYFVSYPVLVDDYWVCVVLGLQASVINKYYSLKKSSVELHTYRQIPVTTSLVDAAVCEFLANSTEELLKPDPGCDLGHIDVEECLRSAGNRLMTGVMCRVDKQRIVGMHNLFRACNTISSLYYEKTVASGSILIARKEHPAIVKLVEFALPTGLTNYRTARKMLELASDQLFLHSDSETIYGLSTLGDYSENMEDLYRVNIMGHHHWELRHGKHILMRVCYGLPALPRYSFDEQKLRQDLPRLFGHIDTEVSELLICLVRAAGQASHGTMLVITAEAASEANRLKTQGTPVMAVSLTPELLRHLTTIDGAVIITPNGVCHAIGTILDGMATEKGNPGRGARYNSALRYIEGCSAPCMSVVVSEDGGIDIIPDLRPAIKRSAIDQIISDVRGLLDAENISRRQYNSLLDWLDGHRFYLKQDDCDVLNAIVSTLDDRLIAEDESAIKKIRKVYVSDPDMNESLYYAAE